MSCEADNKMEVDEEAVATTARQVSSESYKEQYRQLKSKLKYLVYVRKRCMIIFTTACHVYNY